MLDCVLDILSLKLGDTGSYLNLTGNIHIFVLPGNQPCWVRVQILPSLLWAVVSISVPFSKPFQVSVDFPCMGPTLSAVWNLGGGLLAQFLKSLVCSLGSETRMLSVEGAQFIHNLVGLL